MAVDRRSLLGFVGAAAAGSAVRSLEASSLAAFSDPRAAGSSDEVNALRRTSYGANHPFFEPPASVDVSAVSSLGDGVDRSFRRYVVGVASGGGANASLWLTELQGSNPYFHDSSFEAVLHPRDTPASSSDPVSAPQVARAGRGIRLLDPLQSFFGASGAGWLELRCADPLNFSTAYTFNQAADGTQQGLGLKVFDAATIMRDDRFAHTGDEVTFELYGGPVGEPLTKRENWLLFAPPESGDVVLTYDVIGAVGQTLRSDFLEIPSGTFKQLNNIQQVLGVEVRPGNRLRTRVRSRDGGDVALYQLITKVDNLDPLKQDPIGDEGQMSRLVNEALLSVSGGEVNDPYVIAARVNAARDTLITSVYFDLDGDGVAENPADYRDINTQSFNRQTIAQHPGSGTWTPRMRVFFNRPGFGDFARDFTGQAYTVTPARDDTPADSYNTTKDNIDTIATILGDNVNAVFLQNNTHYSKPDMVNILTAYTDGVVAAQNPELSHVIIYGSNNKIDFRRTDGGTAVWGGLNRLQLKQLRTIYGVNP